MTGTLSKSVYHFIMSRMVGKSSSCAIAQKIYLLDCAYGPPKVCKVKGGLNPGLNLDTMGTLRLSHLWLE